MPQTTCTLMKSMLHEFETFPTARTSHADKPVAQYSPGERLREGERRLGGGNAHCSSWVSNHPALHRQEHEQERPAAKGRIKRAGVWVFTMCASVGVSPHWSPMMPFAKQVCTTLSANKTLSPSRTAKNTTEKYISCGRFLQQNVGCCGVGREASPPHTSTVSPPHARVGLGCKVKLCKQKLRD